MDDRKIWKNWTFLKNELHVEDFIDSMKEAGLITSSQERDILHVQPNTRQMKAEKFLNILMQTGEKGFEVFCETLRGRCNDNRYKVIMEKLDIAENAANVMVVHPMVNDDAAAASSDQRPDSRGSQRPMSSSSVSTDVSSRSLPSRDGETGERNMKSARQAWRSQQSSANSSASSRRPPSSGEGRVPPGVVRAPSTGETTSGSRFNIASSNVPPTQPLQATTSQSTSQSAASAANDQRVEAKNLSFDMNLLEQELVRIAPTIAELFQKISKTTSSHPVSEEEIQIVKNENERLRKTNRALIEKLNNFQQKIIQLQLENKNLRECGEGAKEAKDELLKKARELKDLENRLEEQKRALEEKEVELNLQLMKIKDIEEDIVRQKRQITKLETLHEEGQQENSRQQEEITMLKEERLKQKEQIATLELKQRFGDERLRRLEERLKDIEESPQQRRNVRSRDPKFRNNKRLLGQMFNSEIT